jgi:hypothetical protein
MTSTFFSLVGLSKKYYCPVLFTRMFDRSGGPAWSAMPDNETLTTRPLLCDKEAMKIDPFSKQNFKHFARPLGDPDTSSTVD